MKNIFRGNVRKGGEGTPLTDKIRKVVFEVFPIGLLKEYYESDLLKFKILIPEISPGSINVKVQTILFFTV